MSGGTEMSEQILGEILSEIKSMKSEMQSMNGRLSSLEKGQHSLTEGQAALEKRQAALEGQAELHNRLAALEEGQNELNTRQAALEKGQAERCNGQVALEKGQDEIRSMLHTNFTTMFHDMREIRKTVDEFKLIKQKQEEQAADIEFLIKEVGQNSLEIKRLKERVNS